MSEQVPANNLPTVTEMNSFQQDYSLPPGEILTISAYGVDVPEVGPVKAESDKDLLTYGRTSATIDTTDGFGQSHVDIYDVSATPWREEDTNETGNFLAAYWMMGDKGMTLHAVHRLRPDQRVEPNGALLLGINSDGRLLIANTSKHALRVRNQQRSGTSIERPAMNPVLSQEIARPAGTLAAAKTVQPPVTEAGLPKREPGKGPQISSSLIPTPPQALPEDPAELPRAYAHTAAFSRIGHRLARLPFQTRVMNTPEVEVFTTENLY